MRIPGPSVHVNVESIKKPAFVYARMARRFASDWIDWRSLWVRGLNVYSELTGIHRAQRGYRSRCFRPGVVRSIVSAASGALDQTKKSGRSLAFQIIRVLMNKSASAR